MLLWVDQNAEGDYGLVASHSTLPFLAAITTLNGKVDLLNETADKLESLPLEPQSSSSPTSSASSTQCLTWHPTRKLLALGWTSGTSSLVTSSNLK